MTRTYGRVDFYPKYLPNTMVEVEDKMVRYGDLDERFQWVEITMYKDPHPVFIRGIHYGDTEV